MLFFAMSCPRALGALVRFMPVAHAVQSLNTCQRGGPIFSLVLNCASAYLDYLSPKISGFTLGKVLELTLTARQEKLFGQVQLDVASADRSNSLSIITGCGHIPDGMPL
jgi:hypothetical protein